MRLTIRTRKIEKKLKADFEPPTKLINENILKRNLEMFVETADKKEDYEQYYE